MVITIGKFNNKIVEIVRVQQSVQFSDKKNWVLICFDFEKPNRKRDQFKWLLVSDIKFDWIREYNE